MPLIRKERAGNDSFGNQWPEDGAVVEVEPEHAAALLAITDGGFSEVTPAADEEPQEPKDPEEIGDPQDPDDPEEKEVSEVDPEAPTGEPKAAPAAKKTAARKAAARKPVEE